MEEEKIECTGKCYFVLLLALFQFMECGILLIVMLKCKVQGFFAYVLLDLILVMLCSIAIYFLLYWKNKKIVMSDNEIIYYPIIGKVRTYSWNDVKKIYYKSGLRGHSRLVIETDKKIYMDCEMMKNCGAMHLQFSKKYRNQVQIQHKHYNL